MTAIPDWGEISDIPGLPSGARGKENCSNKMLSENVLLFTRTRYPSQSGNKKVGSHMQM